MKQKIYIIISIIGFISCKQENPLVSSIALENQVECEIIGFAGSPSGLYRKFEQLMNITPKEELLKLIYHDSLAVVGYASYALIDKELIEPDKLLKRFLNDKKQVETLCGCIMSEETISSLIYHRYWNSLREYPDEADYTKYIFNDSKELQKMDSLIIFSESPDRILLSKALENRIYSDDYTSRIEEWALEKGDFYALKYVFKNLKNGNEYKLKNSLNEFLQQEKVYDNQRKEIDQILSEL